MRTQVIFASILMLTVSLAGCITDSAVEETNDDTVEQTTDDTVEQTTDEMTEVWGCLDASSLNYDVNATNSSDLCLSEAQLLLAEDVFWSSWDADAVNNATEPVGYRLMLEETSENENESRSLDVQEVFSSDYYNQEIEYRECLNPDTLPKSDNSTNNQWDCANWCECKAAGDNGLGVTVGDVDDDESGVLSYHHSSQTVFDNVVQVEKFSDGEWDNYSMDTASTYDEFRNRLEHGPGIRSSDEGHTHHLSYKSGGREDGGAGNNDCNDRRDCVNPGFPSIVDSEYTHTVIDLLEDEVELSASGRQQTIHYFAKDTSTGTEIEVIGVMTEDGFKITEYYNEIPSTNYSIIDSYMTPTDLAVGDNNTSPIIISARIILLEVDGNDMRFEEYDYSEPVNSRSENGVITVAWRAIPFYFDWISDSDTNETENKSATEEGRKGLNAVNVKVVIAGPSGPYGMEGDLSDYQLITSNCTFDNATTGEDYTAEADNMTRDDETTEADNTTKADEEETSGRSENGTLQPDVDRNEADAVSALPTGKRVYGSDGNACTNIDVYNLSDLDGLEEHGIVFVDADSSGTLSEGDRFEFSDNFTCDDCAEANMLRLFSTSANEFSDGNIDPSSKMSSIHQGAMNAIRNVRSIDSDDPAPPVRAQDHNTTRSNRHT